MKPLIFKEEIYNITPQTFNREMEGSISVLIGNQFDIDTTNLCQKEVYTTSVKKEEDHIELHFEILGNINYTSTFNRNLSTLSGRYSFFYEPAIEGKLEYIPIKEKRKAVGVEFTKEYLNSILGGQMELLGDFWRNIEIQKDDCWIENAVINSELQHLLYQIENCSYQGVMKWVFLQSKVNELLMYVIHQKASINDKKVYLSHREKEQLYYAGELVQKNFDNPLSLQALASQIGMSETKLKKSFKMLFGMTVFQYLMQQRMQKAKHLLLESQYNIAEISDIVGYKNPTHFTAAFKRFFGMLPSELKK